MIEMYPFKVICSFKSAVIAVVMLTSIQADTNKQSLCTALWVNTVCCELYYGWFSGQILALVIKVYHEQARCWESSSTIHCVVTENCYSGTFYSIKSNHILLVTYTCLADVIAVVAKCLCSQLQQCNNI
jgi:hypothetical protein